MGLDCAFERQGRVFIAQRIEGNWSHYQPLESTTPAELGCFGQAVALEGDRLAVGAYFDSIGAKNSGSVYVFDRGPGGWSLALKNSPHDPSDDQYFGGAVGVAGSQLLVGAMGDDGLGSFAGAAYALEIDDSVVAYCQTAPNSVGDGARASTAGSVSVAQNDFHLAAAGLPPGSSGSSSTGRARSSYCSVTARCASADRFSAWMLCSPRRRATASTGSTSRCRPRRVVQVSSPPGSTWNFQYWYRDPDAGGANLNLRHALRVTFCP